MSHFLAKLLSIVVKLLTDILILLLTKTTPLLLTEIAVPMIFTLDK